MLNALIEYAKKNLTDAEPGFARKQVKWAICCDQAGRYTGLLELGDDKGRWFDQSPVTPNMNSGGKSHFLVETLDTVTLFGKELLAEATDQNKLSVKHQFFRELLNQASEQVPLFNTLTALLSDTEQLAQIHQDIAAKDKIKITDITTFRIDETIPLGLNIWHDWWRSYYVKATDDGSTNSQNNLTRCLLTGDLINALDSHPKVKGLAGVGGQPSGDVIVGMDKDAFQSYGLKKSQNAAMSAQTASAYVESLNLLIDQNGMRLGNTIVVHWFNKKIDIPGQDDPLAWLQSPPESGQAETSALFASKKMLKAIHSGKRPDLENNQYYALMLSGAAGRVMIRDWVEGPFTELVENINHWFDDLAIIARHGESLAPQPKFMAVGGALVRDLKELPAPLIQQLWHAAVTNTHIPYNALSQATLRVRIDIIQDTPLSHARMGLIKAYHCRKGDIAMRETVNPNHPEAAYHCGRLLAVLARLQHSALGDVGAGVVQRYYTAASQTPALLIGRLIANAKNHLNKLEGGLSFWYEDRIAEVMTAIGDRAPATLTLEKQSLFALGYYQQLAEMKKKKIPAQNDAQTSID